MVRLDIEKRDAPIESVRDLQSLCEELGCGRSNQDESGEVWLRGLCRADYRLLPPVGRRQECGGQWRFLTLEEEERLIRRFLERVQQDLKKRLIRWIGTFVARHHGLPVRLLDWTVDPKVALFFVCGDRQEEDSHGKIWILLPRADGVGRLDLRDTKTKPPYGPIHAPGIQLVVPPRPDTSDDSNLWKRYEDLCPRIDAQNGRFTVQENPWWSLEHYAEERFFGEDFFSDEARPLGIEKLVECIVPADSKPRIGKELNSEGVTRSRLFPGLDAIVEEVVREVLA